MLQAIRSLRVGQNLMIEQQQQQNIVKVFRNALMWVEREVGGESGMGTTCKSMADSRQCMTKTTTIL